MRKSHHNLSHYRLASLTMGDLQPCGIVEALPGDVFVHRSTVLARVAALVAPLMHPVQLRVHHFFVPSRLIWDNFEAFITGRDTDLTVPTVAVPTENYTALLDHMGVPDVDDQVINVLPFRAYQLIWNEYFRDQQIDTAAVISTANGPDTTTELSMKKVRWQKDYFTTARPYPQLGDAAVTIPFSSGTLAPVKGIGVTGSNVGLVHNASNVRETDGTDNTYANAIKPDPADTNPLFLVEADGDTAGFRPNIYADLSEVDDGGIDVNDLRRSLARQRFLEARNRYGDRYTDYLRYLGERPGDARLQRPELLGHSSRVISFSEVLATAEAGNQKVGDMAGHGIVALRGQRYRRRIPEHGYVISLISARPTVMYSQQLQRMWLRQVKDDFWQKENEAEGPQPVYTRELYAGAADPTTIFGWTGRHDDYRRLQSYVSGTFRTTEDDWHLARIFETEPALNASFLSCVPRDDIYASSGDPQLYCMIDHSISARRLVSKVARH